MKDGRIACVNPEAKYLDPNNYLDYPGLEKVNEWLVDIEKHFHQTYTESEFIRWVELIQEERYKKGKSPREIYGFIMDHKSPPMNFSVDVFIPMYRHAKALLAIYIDLELSNFIYVQKDLSTVYLQSQAGKPEPKETVPVTYEANNRNHARSALHHSVNNYDINNDDLNDNKVVALENQVYTGEPKDTVTVIHAVNNGGYTRVISHHDESNDEVVALETATKPTLSKTDALRKDTFRKYLEAGNDFLSKLPFDVEVIRDFQDRELIDLWEQHLAYLKVEPIARGYD